MKSALIHPLDFDALYKGQKFTLKETEEMLGARFGHEHYGLKLVNIFGQIHFHRPELDPCSVKGCLYIRTDPEQDEEGRKQMRQQVRDAGRNHRRMIGVDQSKIPEDERKQLELTTQHTAARYAMLMRHQREVARDLRLSNGNVGKEKRLAK
jgi:hypothetical protein